MEPFESLGTVSYSHSVASMAVSLAVLTQYTNVTDNRQTAQDGIGKHRMQTAKTFSIMRIFGIMSLNSPGGSTLQ